MADRTRGRKISDEVLDELLAGQDPAEAFRSGTLIDDLKQAVAERALDAEMAAHLEREGEQDASNHRNCWLPQQGGRLGIALKPQCVQFSVATNGTLQSPLTGPSKRVQALGIASVSLPQFARRRRRPRAGHGTKDPHRQPFFPVERFFINNIHCYI